MRNQTLNSQFQALDNLLDRTHFASNGDIELMGHWGRYLCVMAAGFLENSLQVLFSEYVHRRANDQVYRFAKNRLDNILNPKAERFVETARYFDREWASRLSDYLEEDDGVRKGAVNSIMSNRHRIAHGETSQISVGQVRQYWHQCVQVVDFIENMLSS